MEFFTMTCNLSSIAGELHRRRRKSIFDLSFDIEPRREAQPVSGSFRFRDVCGIGWRRCRMNRV